LVFGYTQSTKLWFILPARTSKVITIGSSLKSLMNLSGRHAVITGATGYLGRVICETLAELGASLVLVDKPGAMFEQVEWPLR